MAGAETMFTSGISGRIKAASASGGQRLRVEVRDFAFVLDLDRFEAFIGNLPRKRAELVDRAPMKGFRRGASSALMEAMLSALVTAPASR